MTVKFRQRKSERFIFLSDYSSIVIITIIIITITLTIMVINIIILITIIK